MGGAQEIVLPEPTVPVGPRGLTALTRRRTPCCLLGAVGPGVSELLRT